MGRPSVLLLAALLPGQPGATQEVSSPPDERVVRVWLGSPGPFAPGDPVRVYVQTTEDGYLIVLRSGTDGHIRVLYPSDARDRAGSRTRAGTYEIRAADEAVAFVIDEPLGIGRVLAALSPRPYRSDEFVHETQWNPEALFGSGSTADVEGAMTDIVQRMLGDGYFTYDVVSYTVAPRRYAYEPPSSSLPPPSAYAPQTGYEYMQGAPAPCLGCTFVSVIVIDPFLGCDPFSGVCVGFPLVDLGRRHNRGGLCNFGDDCWRQDRTLALAFRDHPALRARGAPGRPSAPPRSTPARPSAGAPIEPRRRMPTGAASAALLATAATRRATESPARRPAAAAGRTVTLGMVRTSPRARPDAPRDDGIVPAAPAAVQPVQPSRAVAQPVARALVRSPGASLPASAVPSRAWTMTYGSLPARSGAAAGVRSQPAGVTPRRAGATAAWRGVPPRAMIRRR